MFGDHIQLQLDLRRANWGFLAWKLTGGWGGCLMWGSEEVCAYLNKERVSKPLWSLISFALFSLLCVAGWWKLYSERWKLASSGQMTTVCSQGYWLATNYHPSPAYLAELEWKLPWSGSIIKLQLFFIYIVPSQNMVEMCCGWLHTSWCFKKTSPETGQAISNVSRFPWNTGNMPSEFMWFPLQLICLFP